MAYEYNGTNQYLSATVAAFNAISSTASVRAYATQQTDGRAIMQINRSSSGDIAIRYGILSTIESSTRRVNVISQSTSGNARSTYTNNAMSLSTWHQTAVTQSSTTNLVGWLDASNANTQINTGSPNPTALTFVAIGARISAANGTIGLYWPGRLAEQAIWNVALTDDEIVALSKGFKPSRIRPQALVFYVPAIRNIQDVLNAVTITNNGTATVTEHPRVY
jgi:hypothetical protein